MFMATQTNICSLEQNKELQLMFDPTATAAFQAKLMKPPLGQSKSSWLKSALNDLQVQSKIHLERHKYLGNAKSDDGVFHWGRIACFQTNEAEVTEEYQQRKEEAPADRQDDDEYIWSKVQTPDKLLPCSVNKIKCVICGEWRDYTIANFKSHSTAYFATP